MVHPDGLRAMKGVHSLGWVGWWKRAGGNRIVVGECQWVMYLCFGARVPMYLCFGARAYVFMVFGARVPMYLYLGWNACVILGREPIC
jgi:hypothetical protein